MFASVSLGERDVGMPDYSVDFTKLSGGVPSIPLRVDPDQDDLGFQAKLATVSPNVNYVGSDPPTGAPQPWASAVWATGAGLDVAVRTSNGVTDYAVAALYATTANAATGTVKFDPFASHFRVSLNFIAPYAILYPNTGPPNPHQVHLHDGPHGGWAVGVVFKSGNEQELATDVKVSATCRFNPSGVRMNIQYPPGGTSSSDIVANDYEGFQSSRVAPPRHAPTQFTLNLELNRSLKKGTKAQGIASLQIGDAVTPLTTFTPDTFKCGSDTALTSIGVAVVIPPDDNVNAQYGYASVRLQKLSFYSFVPG